MSLPCSSVAPPDEAERVGLSPGAIIQGKYLVHRVIGRGGMCVVGSATHISLDHLVALKVLRRSLSQSKEAVLRFMREARSAAHLKSEHAAHVFDVSVLDTGEPFMVMEHLDGQDLGALLASSGPLSTVDAVECILQACEAIGEAHSAGIVHRDLKPENLFLTRRADGEPQIKVLDFGIATAMLGEALGPRVELAITQGSTTFGTPPYMSPEQLCDPRDVDARADIYGLGVTLYELISGRVPFEGQSGAEVYGSILTQRVPPLHELDPTAPPALDTVLTRCMARRRSDRFANVSELAAALIPFGPPRAQQYAERVSRIMSRRRLSFSPVSHAGPATPTVRAASGSQPSATPSTSEAVPVSINPAPAAQHGPALESSTNEAVPASTNTAPKRVHEERKRRLLGAASIIAAVAAMTMLLTSAAGGVVDSGAVHAAAPSSPHPAKSAATPMGTTARGSRAWSAAHRSQTAPTPSHSGSSEAASVASQKPPLRKPKAFNPYAGRK